MQNNVVETINGVLQKHRLCVKKIYRLGTRSFAVLAVRGKEGFFFKMALFFDGDKSYENTNKKIRKESLFLKFLNSCPKFRFKKSIPHIVDFGGDPNWYLWRFVGGRKQNVSDSTFLFGKDFFNRKNLNFLVDFFANLHYCSRFLPNVLKRRFSKSRPDLKSYEDVVNLPYLIKNNGLGAIKNKINKRLNENRKIFDDSTKFLTHYEPYAPHFFRQSDNGIVVIDWENIGFGNPVHDLSIIWIRAYNNDKWQKEFLKLILQKINYKKEDIEKIFETEIIIQSIANLDYFRTTTHPEEKAERRGVEKQMKKYLELAIQGELFEYYD